MENKLEVHTLLNKKDIDLFIKTNILFKNYINIDFVNIVHEDGSFSEKDFKILYDSISDVRIILKNQADNQVEEYLKEYPLCSHFRFSEHHTIFKLKLFDPFLLTNTNNVLYMDSDVLFCKKPLEIIENINNKVGFYLRDSWSSYCVPFRDEDGDDTIHRFINAGLTYFPTPKHYSLYYIEECLSILYDNGSKYATHPFLEQTCIAYLISKQDSLFKQLTYPDYCIPTFGEFIPDHNLTVLHLNSSPLVGKYRLEHYNYELKKLQYLNSI